MKMSLRSKTLLAVTITLVGLVASLSLLISTVFARGLLRIEREDLQHHVHEALDRLHAKDSLVLRADWASWDDAYRFIEDENGDFVRSNLTENVLGKLDLDALVFVSLSGKVVHCSVMEPESGKSSTLPAWLAPHIAHGTPLCGGTNPSSRTCGLLRNGSDLFLAGSLPILTSRSEGPVRGHVICLKRIHTLSFEPPTSAKAVPQEYTSSLLIAGPEMDLLSADLARAERASGDEAVIVRPLDQQYVAGYTHLRDLYGAVAGVLKVQIQRSTWQQGCVARDYMIRCVLIVALAFCGTVLLLMQHLVLSPLLELKKGVRSVTRHQDLSERLALSRQDELGSLAKDINEMLDSLEQARNSNRETEARFRNLVETTTDIVWETDANLLFTYVSPQVKAMLGYEPAELLGRLVSEIQPPADGTRLSLLNQPELALREPFHPLKDTLLHKDGTRRLFETSGQPYFDAHGTFLGYRGVARDITARTSAEQELALYKEHLEALVEDRSRELVSAQQQLMQKDKLASVGQLAAGIAHEINTPIQYVGDNLQALSDFITELTAMIATYRTSLHGAATGGSLTPEVLAAVSEAEKTHDIDFIIEDAPNAISQGLEGVKRVAHIVRAMKDFSHVDREEMAMVDLNRAIENTLTVARNEYKYVADAVTELGELPLVHCFGSEVNQVLLNIIVNAAHAIGDTGARGTITVRTRLVDEQSVEIAISDTGTGIPESARAKVFDPFFTTKEVGKGTGQGLNIAHRVVVERHHGSLTFETEIGKGTTFLIRLPVRQEKDELVGGAA